MSTGYLVVDLGGVVFHFDHARRLERLAQACGRKDVSARRTAR
ncbi:hypothetical protein [Dactylosporangium maewongense]